MKVSEAIKQADELRDNALSDEIKAGWLYTFEDQLAEMFDADPYDPEIDGERWPVVDTELRMPSPYAEVYVLHLVCKIDYYNQESVLYANDTAVFNEAFAEAQGYYRRQNVKNSKGNWRVM